MRLTKIARAAACFLAPLIGQNASMKKLLIVVSVPIVSLW
jgi:hypothetical protein